MAPKNVEKLAKKNGYLERLKDLIRNTPRILIVHADHVGSRQMQEIRISLRGKAFVLMGKNTMMRTALGQYQEENPNLDLSALIEIVRGNIGFIFCKVDPDEIRAIVTANKVPAAAKAGVVAPIDVSVPAGPTGLDPSQTTFFQALNIATKIVKGQIEIVNEVHLIKAGIRVQMSEQVLLQKLHVNPFSYSLKVTHIFENGNVFDAAVLDITDAVILSKIQKSISYVAALSREVGIPTAASIPHALAAAFKNLAAVCAETECTFKEVATLKEFLKDPSKFAKAAAPAAKAASPKAGAKAKAPEPEEEEDDGAAGFSLFD